jgi:hypothetical protein
MLKGIPILFTWLFLGAFLAFPSPAPILFRVGAPPNKDGVIVRPYIAPYLNLKPDADTPLPALKPGDILSCSQGQTQRNFDDHHDNFVTFECVVGDSRKGQKITLTLDGLRFADDPYDQEKK